MTVQGVFNTVKQIYSVRSEIMHKGHTKKLTADLFYQLAEIVRISLNIYSRNKVIFSQLETMCLN